MGVWIGSSRRGIGAEGGEFPRRDRGAAGIVTGEMATLPGVPLLLMLGLSLAPAVVSGCHRASPSDRPSPDPDARQSALAEHPTAPSAAGLPRRASGSPTCAADGGQRPLRPVLASKDLPAGPFLGPPPALSGKVKAECDRVGDRHKRLVEGYAKAHPDARPIDAATLGACFAGPRGDAWALEIVEIHPIAPRELPPEEPAGAYTGSWGLVFIDEQGKRSHDEWKAKLEGRAAAVVTPTVRLVHDFDGDGRAEIIVDNETRYSDEHEPDVSMLTLREGVIRSYEPAEKYAQGRPVDVDGDGRIDFELRPVMSVDGPCGLSGITYGGPLLIAHALPDGRYSTDDAVVREATRQRCAGVALEPLVGPGEGGAPMPDPEQIAMRVACARLRGQSAAAISERLRAEYTVGARAAGGADGGVDVGPLGACLPLELVLKLAAEEPPFLVDPCL